MYCPYHLGYGSWGNGALGGWIGLIVTLAFWAIIIVGVVLLIRWLVIRGGQAALPLSTSRETALDILRKRYAGGEISKEEFEERKKDLV